MNFSFVSTFESSSDVAWTRIARRPACLRDDLTAAREQRRRRMPTRWPSSLSHCCASGGDDSLGPPEDLRVDRAPSFGSVDDADLASCSASAFWRTRSTCCTGSMSGWHREWSIAAPETLDLFTGRREMQTCISHASRLHFLLADVGTSRIFVRFWYTKLAGMRSDMARGGDQTPELIAKEISPSVAAVD